MNRKITLITTIIVVSGLFVQLAAVVSFTPYNWIIKSINMARLISPHLNLSYLTIRLFVYHNHTTDLGINFLDLSIYISAFVGLIAYIQSKGKEIRLLRLVFSIIILTKVIGITGILISAIMTGLHGGLGTKWYYWLISLVFNGLWCALGVYSLKALSIDRVPEKQQKPESNTENSIFVESPKSQRFVHHILDLFLSIFICSYFTISIFGALFGNIENASSEKLALYALVITCRLLYYPFFEVIFGATPAKFLTGSRVVMANGDKINLKTGLLRTLTRHVPFEAFSYLGEGNGWHDAWLNTKVIKEENTGAPAKKYLWVIALFIIIGVSSYAGYELNEKYQRQKSQKENYISKIKNIELNLKQLTDSHVLEVKPAKDYPPRKSYYYLKVEEIMDDDILFSIFQTDDYSPTNFEIETNYLSKKDELSTILIPREQLLQSLTYDYEKYKNGERNGQDILKIGTNYEIDEVYKIFAPSIKLGGFSSYGRGSLSIGINNEGREATLISIDNIEGNLNWTNELPQKIHAPNQQYISNSISLHADNFEYGKKYKFTLSVRDSSGNLQKYMIEGINGDHTFRQINDLE